MLMVPVGVLTGLACAVWVLALGARMRSEGGAFNILFRFVLVPMTLFSGSFFPITEMPLAIRWLAWISPLWYGNELARGAALGGLGVLAGGRPPGLPARPAGQSARWWPAAATGRGWSYERRPDERVGTGRTAGGGRRPPALILRVIPLQLYAGRSWVVLERNLRVYRRVLDDHRLRVLRAGVLPARARSGARFAGRHRSTPGPARSATRPTSRPGCWRPRR